MQKEDRQYEAGKHNIGEKEVSVRKKFFYFFLVLTASLTVWSFHYCDSLMCWSAMLLSSFATMVLYLEVRYQFCVLFGFFNLYNFGRLGNLHEVKNKEDGKKDWKKTAQMSLFSLFIATSYATLIHWLAMK